MKISKRYIEAFERAKESPAYWTESALLDVARRLLVRMKELGLSQASLAEKMGRKAPYINRVLSGKHNVTVETLSTAALAMGMKVDIRFEPIQEAKKTESLTFPVSVGTTHVLQPAATLRLVKTEPFQGTLTSAPSGSLRKAA